MRTALLAAWLLPVAAFAQTTGGITITSTSSTSSTGGPAEVLIGKAACTLNTPVPFAVNLGTSGQLGTTPTVGVLRNANNANCSSGGALDTTLNVSFSGGTANFQSTPSELFVDAPDGGGFDCNTIGHTSASPATFFVCVQSKQSALTGTTTLSDEIAVKFATQPPAAPTTPVVAAGDSQLRVGWSPGNAADRIATYDVHVARVNSTFDLNAHKNQVNGGQNSLKVSQTDDGTALENDAGYVVQVLATDVYDNVSGLSPPAVGSPQAVADFYDHYRNDGGGALGGHGCSSTGGVAWIAALGFVVALLARRRHAAAACLVVFALAIPAHAAESDRPPRRLLVGFKVDRYDPKVDSEKGLAGRTPYADIFGNRKPLRYQLEADWEVAHPFGSLLLGATIGYWQNFGKGLVHDTTATVGQRSDDTSLLDVIPFGAVATYRFDYLADRYRWFPLIPYAQAGLQRALWASYSGSGSVSHAKVDGRRGSGWSYGYTTAVGVALNLDAIDPGVAREAYQDVYIQRTAVFAEYGWTRLDDFNKAGGLILTDRAWRFGLSLEF